MAEVYQHMNISNTRWVATSKSSVQVTTMVITEFRNIPRFFAELCHLYSCSTLSDQVTELSVSDPGAMDFEASCNSPNPWQFAHWQRE